MPSLVPSLISFLESLMRWQYQERSLQWCTLLRPWLFNCVLWAYLLIVPVSIPPRLYRALHHYFYYTVWSFWVVILMMVLRQSRRAIDDFTSAESISALKFISVSNIPKYDEKRFPFHRPVPLQPDSFTSVDLY